MTATRGNWRALLMDTAALARQRAHDRRTEVSELRMELMTAGMEMRSIGQRIHDALTAGHLKAIEHEAGRLWTLGSGYIEAAS